MSNHVYSQASPSFSQRLTKHPHHSTTHYSYLLTISAWATVHYLLLGYSLPHVYIPTSSFIGAAVRRSFEIKLRPDIETMAVLFDECSHLIPGGFQLLNRTVIGVPEAFRDGWEGGRAGRMSRGRSGLVRAIWAGKNRGRWRLEKAGWSRIYRGHCLSEQHCRAMTYRGRCRCGIE